jgi:branched-chain amino acid transport system substrate-binding protein
MRKYFKLMVTLVALIMLSGCFTEKSMTKAREAFAEKNPGKITIGIVGPMNLMQDSTGFLKGVNLALTEVNAKKGGSILKIRVENDQANFMDGIRIAQRLAAQPEITAVIGHWNSSITIPAARIYNDAGLVMLSPVVSNTELTSKGYAYVFRNTLSDAGMGRQLAQYAKKMHYRRIVIYYADNEYGMGLANAFEDAFSDNDRKVIDRVTDFNNVFEFDQAVNKWSALDYDAIFVADSMPHATEFLRRLRTKNGNVPLFGGDGLDVADFPAKLGAAAKGVVVATMFNPQEGRIELQKFMTKYRKHYHRDPDVWAVQGYDSIKLLTYAVKKAGSPSPQKIAEALRGLQGWPGILGTVSFDATGELKGIGIVKKIVQDGKFEYIR